MKRVILIVLDSVGIGFLPDAQAFSDEGANTLGNLYLAKGHLKIPNLSQLGLGRLVDIGDMPAETIGCYGKMTERSASKDTTIGHWEIQESWLINLSPPTLMAFRQPSSQNSKSLSEPELSVTARLPERK